MSGGAGKKVVVAVTGASGYVASWLVKLLLERGYTVKASVRDLSDPRKTEFLMALEGAKERLQLFQANLMEDGSFDAIVDGCEGVFHTASPVQLSVSNPQADLLDPAIKGTLNVLKSCTKVPSVRRVVLTSSIAAIINSDEVKDGVLVDETWFSDPLYCEKHEMWYQLSKILAENAAWEFAKKNGIDMIVINPGLVIGPILRPASTFSVDVMLEIVNGNDPFPTIAFPWVDVRDVAYAHILAFEIPSANGRYLAIERSAVSGNEVIKILTEFFPTLQIPDKCSGGSPPHQLKFRTSNEKAKALGINFIPLEVSLKDTIESFNEMNLVCL